MTNRQPHIKSVWTDRQAWEIIGPAVRGCHAGGLRFEVCGGLRRKRDRVGLVHIAVENLPRFDEGVRKLIEAGRWKPDHVFRCTQKDVREAKIYEYVIERLRVLVFHTHPSHWGAMLIHLTGNTVFNRMLRGEAKSQLMRLNQYGLYFHGEIIAGKTEQQIFFALGLEYVYPEHREVDGRFRFRPSRGMTGGLR